MTRQYRAGQTYAMLQQRYNVRKYRYIPLLAPVKIAFCGGMAAILVIRPSREIWWLMRGIFHCGMLSYRLTGSVHEESSRSEMHIDRKEIQRQNF